MRSKSLQYPSRRLRVNWHRHRFPIDADGEQWTAAGTSATAVEHLSWLMRYLAAEAARRDRRWLQGVSHRRAAFA